MRSQIKVVSFCLAVLVQLTGLPPQSAAETAASSFSTADKSWVIMPTPHRFPDLIRRLEEAVKVNEMNIVYVASASEGAKAQGHSIPGNRVVGVFRNDFARRMLAASIPAGIEAPIRIYLVEGANGQTTLAYRRPTQVFAPYFGAPGGDLEKLAGDLDVIFEKIASATVSP